MIKLKVDTKPVTNWLKKCMALNEDLVNKIIEDCIFGMETGEITNLKNQYLTVNDIKEHFRRKANDLNNNKSSRDLYALHEIENLLKGD